MRTLGIIRVKRNVPASVPGLRAAATHPPALPLVLDIAMTQETPDIRAERTTTRAGSRFTYRAVSPRNTPLI